MGRRRKTTRIKYYTRTESNEHNIVCNNNNNNINGCSRRRPSIYKQILKKNIDESLNRRVIRNAVYSVTTVSRGTKQK